MKLLPVKHSQMLIAFSLATLLALSGCDDKQTDTATQLRTQEPKTQPPNKAQQAAETEAAREIKWEELIPAEYSPDAIMEKYGDEISQMQDGSSEANKLMKKITAELEQAPVNEAIDKQFIKMPGYIAPLSTTEEGLISEFLLVPYFGACIHVPPPPVNQTVMVSTAAGEGIKMETAYAPIWVIGEITLQGKDTDIGKAGYSIAEAQIERYEMPPPPQPEEEQVFNEETADNS